jgi:hypothetical protein
MNTLLSVLPDLMIFSSIFLIGLYGYWEQQLLISSMDHLLLQMMGLLFVMGWIWFWNTLREKQKRTRKNKTLQQPRPIKITATRDDPDAQTGWRYYDSDY